MNCIIWRRTSTSAPFSASSADAIVALVIVISFMDRFGGSHPKLIRTSRWPPPEGSGRCAASRFGLRPTRLAAQRVKEDLHHLPGHQPPIGWYVAQIGVGANRLPSKIALHASLIAVGRVFAAKTSISFNNLELSRGTIDVVFTDIMNRSKSLIYMNIIRTPHSHSIVNRPSKPAWLKDLVVIDIDLCRRLYRQKRRYSLAQEMERFAGERGFDTIINQCQAYRIPGFRT